ncbi:hypothetical protein J4G37_56710, partial [Microvirga sp. 3-52]|nr:hypothetical protein [Microvirga sp. 3-52]
MNKRNINKLSRKISVGALPVVAVAISLIVVFYQAYCGRHPPAPKRFKGIFLVQLIKVKSFGYTGS